MFTIVFLSRISFTTAQHLSLILVEYSYKVFQEAKEIKVVIQIFGGDYSLVKLEFLT